MPDSSDLHRAARVVVTALAERGVDSAAMWRDNIADRTGLSAEDVGRVLDLLDSGLIRRVAPRRNDEWALTPAGHYAAWLLNDSPAGDPIPGTEVPA